MDDIQLTVTSHASDPRVDLVALSVNAASAALLLSSQPWNGPLGCVRVADVDGVFTVSPSSLELRSATLDLLYAGTVHRLLTIK